MPMIPSLFGQLYGGVALRRRRAFARDASRRRRLVQAVVSVGNLRVGGTGKTPVVAHLARLLLAAGERPAILTRGYGRAVAPEGVTVVSDGRAILAGVDRAGDEPLMLAHQLPGVAVLVGGNRHLSGCLAERAFHATVHLLDDGFQHHQLERDLDLLLVNEDELRDEPLPAGRLREPHDAARAAHALLVTEGDPTDLMHRFGVGTAFRVRRTSIGLRPHGPRSHADYVGEPLLAVAGIARPERFFTEARARGLNVVGTREFPDHHRFSAGDLRELEQEARRIGAVALVTTEKDAVRLPADGLPGIGVLVAPIQATIEPEAAFDDWLLARLQASRAARESARLRHEP